MMEYERDLIEVPLIIFRSVYGYGMEKIAKMESC